MSAIDDYRKETIRYIVGAVVAAVLTYMVYMVAVEQRLEAVWLAVVALGLAMVQLLVQMVSFLHLGNETKPRWKAQSFVFAFLMATVIVVGSIWIMANLDYNMGMSPQQMDEYMIKQNKKGF